MAVTVTRTRARSILTRTCGYLDNVTSHSLQPYRGCSFGASLCGVGCYAKHNAFLTRGAPWGSFLEVRENAAELYLAQHERERRWARRDGGRFRIYMSSTTDPFVPHERRFRVTRRVLEAMCVKPPDELVLQTHTHLVTEYMDLYEQLDGLCRLRVHVSIESDRDRLPGLPPPASPVERRLRAAARLKGAGVQTVVTVSPLLPIEAPRRFFERVAECANAVVIDHFIGGDGSRAGSRTLRTALPAAMAAVDPASVGIEYREQMVTIAAGVMPGRVGIGADGFAGRYLPTGATMPACGEPPAVAPRRC